jgi:hypothetical protein
MANAVWSSRKQRNVEKKCREWKKGKYQEKKSEQTNKFIREKEVKIMFEAIRNIVRKKEFKIDMKPYSFISFLWRFSVNSERLLIDEYKTRMSGAPYRPIAELWQTRKRHTGNEQQQNHRLWWDACRVLDGILHHEILNWNFDKIISKSRSQWPRCLRHDVSSPTQTLGLCVRIPLEAWLSVHVYSVFMLSCV